jgi:hypothetical protein
MVAPIGEIFFIVIPGRYVLEVIAQMYVTMFAQMAQEDAMARVIKFAHCELRVVTIGVK